MRGIIYDFDGVLLDSTKTSGKRFLEAAEKIGLPINDEARNRAATVSKVGAAIAKKIWPNADLDALYRAWEEIDLAYDFKLCPGAIGILEYARHCHYQQSVLSNRATETLEPLMRKLNVERFMLARWACARTAFLKPDPRSAEPLISIYQKKACISRNELLFVGDSATHDWPVARETGAKFVGVLTGADTEDELLAAGVPHKNIIASVAELPDWLERHDRR